MKQVAVRAKPTCAVCGTPVESMYEAHDPFMQRVVWIVCCHGKTERVQLDDCELAEAKGEVEMGMAFVPAPEMKRLGP